VKKFYLVILIIILNSTQFIYAQELDNAYDPSWDIYLNNYNQYEKERPKKQITQDEFNSAIEVIKSYQKDDKKSKRKWWLFGKKEEKNTTKQIDTKEENQVKSPPPSPEPLLRLPVDVYNNDLIIKNGFYLIDTVKRDNKYFLKFKQGSMDIAEEVLKRLKFDNETIGRVSTLVKEHMSRFEHLRTGNIKRFINRVGIENLDLLFELQIADIKGSKPPYDFSEIIKLKEECKRIIDEKQPLTVKDLAINGHDLMALGYKQGKDIGTILTKLLELVIENPELNIKEKLLGLIWNIHFWNPCGSRCSETYFTIKLLFYEKGG